MPFAAIALACTTLILWSFVAVLGARLDYVPPFLLVGLSLTVSGLLGLIRVRQWRVPLRTLAVGVGGIFGYHYLLFSAFQLAPAVEANLINYLWPLLIVLLTPLFLSGFRLRLYHLVGGLLGLAGVALVVTGGRVNPDLASLPGYLMAAGAALIWSCYSLLTKRLPAFPTAAVGGFCLASGLLSLLFYRFSAGPLYTWIWPRGIDWLVVVFLGAGPMGAAFFTWDAALKRGDPRIIGSLSYLTPLASTLILVGVGGRSLSWISAIAMALIMSGAVLGSLDLFRPLLTGLPFKTAK